MSKQANPTVIGGFVIGAIALTVAGVLIFSSGKWMENRTPYVLFFDGSVKGLQVGSKVTFQGVKVGEVIDIQARIDARDGSILIPVFIEIIREDFHIVGGDPKESRPGFADELIARGLRAQMVMESFVTGMLVVELDFHPNTPVKLVGAIPDIKELPTVSSGFALLGKKLGDLNLDELADESTKTVESINKLLNSQEFKETLIHFRDMIKNAKVLLKNLDHQVQPISDEIKTVTQSATATMDRGREAVNNLEGEISSTLKDIEALAESINEEVKPLAEKTDAALVATKATMTEGEKAVKKAYDALEQGEKTLQAAETLVAPDSPMQTELRQTVREIGAAASALRVLSDYLQRHPDSLVHGKGGGG